MCKSEYSYPVYAPWLNTTCRLASRVQDVLSVPVFTPAAFTKWSLVFIISLKICAWKKLKHWFLKISGRDSRNVLCKRVAVSCVFWEAKMGKEEASEKAFLSPGKHINIPRRVTDLDKFQKVGLHWTGFFLGGVLQQRRITYHQKVALAEGENVHLFLKKSPVLLLHSLFPYQCPTAAKHTCAERETGNAAAYPY
jgi:hypothetical protein